MSYHGADAPTAEPKSQRPWSSPSTLILDSSPFQAQLHPLLFTFGLSRWLATFFDSPDPEEGAVTLGTGVVANWGDGMGDD